MKTSISAHMRAAAGLSLIAALSALAPAATSADTRATPQPTPAQQTLIELHEYVGAGWWSPVAATPPAAPVIAPLARPVPARWTVIGGSAESSAQRTGNTAL